MGSSLPRIVRIAIALAFGFASILLVTFSTLVLLVALFPPVDTEGEFAGIFVLGALLVPPGIICWWVAGHFWRAAGQGSGD